MSIKTRINCFCSINQNTLYLYLCNNCTGKVISMKFNFLPRDAMHKRGLCCHPVSVRPSVTFVSCAKTNKDIFEIFYHRVATLFWFSHTKGDADIPTGTPLTGASNARGYEKIDDFRPISRCISETVIVRWAHAARQFVSIEFSFHPCNILRDGDSRRGVSRGNKNVGCGT